MDTEDTGFLSKNEVNRFLAKIGVEVNEYYKLSLYKDSDVFEFDGVLSLLGLMEVPH